MRRGVILGLFFWGGRSSWVVYKQIDMFDFTIIFKTR